MGKRGAVLEYVDFMVRTHGKAKGEALIEELRLLSKKSKTFSIGELEELRSDLETKIQELDGR